MARTYPNVSTQTQRQTQRETHSHTEANRTRQTQIHTGGCYQPLVHTPWSLDYTRPQGNYSTDVQSAGCCQRLPRVPSELTPSDNIDAKPGGECNCTAQRVHSHSTLGKHLISIDIWRALSIIYRSLDCYQVMQDSWVSSRTSKPRANSGPGKDNNGLNSRKYFDNYNAWLSSKRDANSGIDLSNRVNYPNHSSD